MKEVIFLSLCIIACTSNRDIDSRPSYNSDKELKSALLNNYAANKETIIEFRNYCSRFSHIVYIGFKDSLVNISYYKDNIKADSSFIEFENETYTSKKTQAALLAEHFPIDSLKILVNNLRKINCTQITILDGAREQIEIEFNGIYGDRIGIYYKVFQYDFNDYLINHFTTFLTNRKQGGILDKNVIWYFYIFS